MKVVIRMACIVLPALIAVSAAPLSQLSVLSPADRPVEPDTTDYAVIETVLNDCTSNPEFALPGNTQHVTVVLCSWTPTITDDSLVANALNEDVQRDLGISLSDTLINAFQARNKTPQALRAFSTTNEYIIVVDEPSQPWDEYWEVILPIDTRGWVAPFLPVYSDDTSTAVLVFCGGPSDHGMTATYVLSRTNEQWMVKGSHYSWYF